MIMHFIRLFFLIRFFPLLFRSRQSMLLEIAALRHQIGILKRCITQAKLKKGNRVFWVMLRKCWTDWRSALLLFNPHTVVEWHSKLQASALSFSFKPQTLTLSFKLQRFSIIMYQRD
ncbi:MAG: hypothetical protein MUP71_02710 [Candidatus Aminicenantes bacterium]|nr:hypothetical protein [Candidatus Aminicenantes bacterium]